jgi:hypothetical protein
MLFDALTIAIDVFAPLGIEIFELLITLELLMDFLTPSFKTEDCVDWDGKEGPKVFSGDAIAPRMIIDTSTLAPLKFAV